MDTFCTLKLPTFVLYCDARWLTVKPTGQRRLLYFLHKVWYLPYKNLNLPK